MFGEGIDRNLFASGTSIDELARYSRRSYPDYLVYAPEIWYEVEQERHANLTLSGEEEELLHNTRFPAFINGRAGSGKSTMLAYTFAYYCDLYLQTVQTSFESDISEEEPFFRPLFLTYSERLTDRAREIVRRILTSHSLYVENVNPGHERVDLSEIDDCFQPFQSFLLQQLPPEVKERFVKRNYISFYRFKNLYAKAYPKSEYNAEICWHAIRTYIKGYQFSEEDRDFLSVEEYKTEIPAARKSIIAEDFERIYGSVWQWYKNLQQEHHYWDDQDLARAVLQTIIQTPNGARPDRYAAIFCDEAQDFTPIEFQVILRLSIWSKYRLFPPVDNLPFAFAGDPMQTLNPTGFNWESLGASFYERILTPLDPENKLGLRDRDRNRLQELQQNYRSSRSLVRFCNIVHLWRRVLFDLSYLRPQVYWWRDREEIPTQKGIIGQNLTASSLRQVINENLIVILPCEEGGEMDFLEQFPDIASIFPDIPRGERPPNVYSALEMKGMEFPAAIVFGFGHYFAREFPGRSLGQFYGTSENLRPEYFLNKLYVAVSRSTEVVGIVDTEAGDRYLWESARQNTIEGWLGRISEAHRPRWREEIATEGLPESFDPSRFQARDPLELARNFLQRGLETRSIDFFASAAYYFDRAGRFPEAEYCRIWRSRLAPRPNLQDAGQRFLQLEAPIETAIAPVLDAWECFWEGQHWENLIGWCDRFPDRDESRWRPIAVYMAGATEFDRLNRLIEFAAFLVSAFPDPDSLSERWGDLSWEAVFTRYRRDIQRLIESNVRSNRTSWISWRRTLETLAEARFVREDSLSLAARCAYRAEEYPRAIALWEQCTENRHREHSEYYLAKARVSSLPEKIEWLSRAGRSQEIATIWRQERNRVADENWRPFIGYIRRALSELERYRDLFILDLQSGHWVQAIGFFNSRVERQDSLFDSRLRLLTLRQMARDEKLNAEAIESEASRALGRNAGERESQNAVRGARRLLVDFIVQTTELPEWEVTRENVIEAGQAFERVGEFVPALQFYERFRRGVDEEIREIARAGWIAVTTARARRSEALGDLDRATRQRREAERATPEWWRGEVTGGRSIEDLRQTLRSRLNNFSVEELQRVDHYLRFLEYERR
jgi:tetratricopeptide (TPR) repeat protein